MGFQKDKTEKNGKEAEIFLSSIIIKRIKAGYTVPNKLGDTKETVVMKNGLFLKGENGLLIS